MKSTKIDLAEKTRKDICELLQNRLYDLLDLASQLKQAHWTVTGPSFIALHELFDEMTGEIVEFGDMAAERIMTLGGQAVGTARATAKGSSLPEYPVNISGQSKHLDALSDVLSKAGARVRADIDRADELGDQGTADLFTEISRGLDKTLWLLEAHMD